MKYNELNEMTIKEWDGEPFKAYVTNKPDETIDIECIETIISFDSRYDEPWGTEDYNNYVNVYPVEWNEATISTINKPKRMTNRQLSKWLAQGNGEATHGYTRDTVIHTLCYDTQEANSFVRDGFKVRTWDSDKWIEPTVDLLDKS